jgi:hypothetical protein
VLWISVLGVDAISLLDREFLGSSFSLLNLTQQVRAVAIRLALVRWAMKGPVALTSIFRDLV